MQLSFTHSDAKFILLISYKKGSKRTVWILVKLGAFMSIGSILLDIKCPLYEWIWRYKVPVTLWFPWSLHATQCITSLLSVLLAGPFGLSVSNLSPNFSLCLPSKWSSFSSVDSYHSFPCQWNLNFYSHHLLFLSRNDPFFTADFSTCPD